MRRQLQKKIVSVLLLLGTLMIFSGCGASENTQIPVAGPETNINKVTISVLGDEEKGTIIKQTAVPFKDGDSVLDVLSKVTRSVKIPLEFRGNGIFAYVEGIGNLYEFDRGPSSGWLFKVNGVQAKKSAGAVKVTEGDSIEWIYSIEQSEDADTEEE